MGLWLLQSFGLQPKEIPSLRSYYSRGDWYVGYITQKVRCELVFMMRLLGFLINAFEVARWLVCRLHHSEVPL